MDGVVLNEWYRYLIVLLILSKAKVCNEWCLWVEQSRAITMNASKACRLNGWGH